MSARASAHCPSARSCTDVGGEVEVGWHLHPDHGGNGYATEAARAAIARGVAAGLEEVVAVVSPDNAASLAVCRRLRLHPRGSSDAYYGRPVEVFATRPHER
ncbi:hypothetical protein GCM10009740_21420 [Terrabacter terrae]|uniref:N-acetyltransferase domain-containing protein n=1 Tax=Terrabacter terrae TaxID=318434 RepID=A0ABP5FPH8_9MICO